MFVRRLPLQGHRTFLLSWTQERSSITASRDIFRCSLDGEQRLCELLSVNCSQNFSLPFIFVCSEVLASEAILNIPTRADWKECKQSREEEEECCKELRDQFQPYDFAWDD